MPLRVTLNGQLRDFDSLGSSESLARVIEALELKADRVAVEHNGVIAPRANWHFVQIKPGDRLEIVHFVGGGALHTLPGYADLGEADRAGEEIAPGARPGRDYT